MVTKKDTRHFYIQNMYDSLGVNYKRTNKKLLELIGEIKKGCGSAYKNHQL